MWRSWRILVCELYWHIKWVCEKWSWGCSLIWRPIGSSSPRRRPVTPLASAQIPDYWTVTVSEIAGQPAKLQEENPFKHVGNKNWIYLHFCLSTWLQQWSTKLTSVVRCLCAKMLTADWSWRGNGLHDRQYREERGNKEKGPESLVSAEFGESWPELKHSDKHTVDVCCQTLPNSLCWWWIRH